jgi:hypothetical protein
MPAGSSSAWSSEEAMAQSDVLQLQEPLKSGGIRSVNFFNGRLLSSKDLTREQMARREADARLGRAIGDGVAYGLEVARDQGLDRPAAPVLRIKAGLALNRVGQTLRLAEDVSVALTRSFASTDAGCIFANCTPLTGGTYVAGAGVYLLTIAPAQMSEGKAATNGLDPANVACNTDATVEAVQFRLINVNPLRYAGLDIGSSLFRNRLAYRCFGIEAREQNVIDPWRVDAPRYGLIDELREVGLDDREVPLAILLWTVGGIQFVDMWATRREVLEPDALSGFSFRRDPLDPANLSSFAFVARRRRLTESSAMCAQFQQHLADVLAATVTPSMVIALEHFRYLPPFGVVPLQSAPLRGYFEQTFFSGLVRRPAFGSNQSTEFIDERLLGLLRQQAIESTPTDVTTGEFIWVYRPWQITAAAHAGQTVQLLVVFASGLVPPLAVARFDMARFGYSNFVDCCSHF